MTEISFSQDLKVKKSAILASPKISASLRRRSSKSPEERTPLTEAPPMPEVTAEIPKAKPTKPVIAVSLRRTVSRLWPSGSSACYWRCSKHCAQDFSKPLSVHPAGYRQPALFRLGGGWEQGRGVAPRLNYTIVGTSRLSNSHTIIVKGIICAFLTAE